MLKEMYEKLASLALEVKEQNTPEFMEYWHEELQKHLRFLGIELPLKIKVNCIEDSRIVKKIMEAITNELIQIIRPLEGRIPTFIEVQDMSKSIYQVYQDHKAEITELGQEGSQYNKIFHILHIGTDLPHTKCEQLVIKIIKILGGENEPNLRENQ